MESTGRSEVQAPSLWTGDRPRRIVLGLSGGVDSAVSAALLKAQGHEVVGVFMKNWEDDDDDEYCSTRQDLIDAASVADVVGIDFEAVNFAEGYRQRVFSIFLAEYSAGRTPNPDILCNAEIKFNAFLDHAISLGAESLATGHYARLRLDSGFNGQALMRLLKASDLNKDQSYFLHRLSQQQLLPAVFPVGDFTKPQVRAMAADLKLPNASKKDSTGICFIGERPFRAFLNRYLPTQPGEMVDDRNRVVGQHMGLAFYTIGQRKGLGIGGRAEGSDEPWFVVAKDLTKNRLHVVQGHDHPKLLTRYVLAGQLHWISGDMDRDPRLKALVAASIAGASCGLAAKTRYRQSDAECQVLSASGGVLKLAFSTPQWAVTPGQSVVLYHDSTCLGGAVIVAASNDLSALEALAHPEVNSALVEPH